MDLNDFYNKSIHQIKNSLESLLNPSAFSVHSIIGWIIILLILSIGIFIYKQCIKTASFIGVGIVLYQCCYSLSLTGLNDIIPISKVCKYDVFMSIAQCFVGTKFSDVLLWFDAFLIKQWALIWCTGGNLLVKTVLFLKDILMPIFEEIV